MLAKSYQGKFVRSSLSFCLLLAPAIMCGSQIPIGYLSWDVNFPGNAGQFDITNLTGPNALPPSFPVSTLVNLSSLSLTVNFVGGGSTTEAAGYFTLSADGESFDGGAIPIGGTNPEPISVTLTGNFSPTSIISGGSPVTIQPGFPVSFSDTPSLLDGDFGVIYATTGTSVPPTAPEPASWLLLAAGALLLVLTRIKLFRKPPAAAKVALLTLTLVLAQSSFGQVVLPAATSPSSGVAGVNNVNVTASQVPAGTVTPGNLIVSYESTCGGSAVKTVSANSIRSILGVDRVNFNIPAGLTTGSYYVQISDTADAVHFTSTDCSEVQVTASTAVLNACVAGSSLGVLLPASGKTGIVTAYVPKAYWGSSLTGVFVKNIEGILGAGSSIATANAANSCSSNPATGQTVCVANNTDVYLISGTTLTKTLTSGSDGTGSFSGGYCHNCGVALNANNNTAVINMGLSAGPSGSGLQILNLNTNTFSTPLPLSLEVSENISVDPTRSLVLSAQEGGNFTVAQIQTNGSLKEFDSSFNTAIENDSSAEDCSTGIGLTPGEFTNRVALVNLNAITFGTTTYTAPYSVPTLVSAYEFSAGLSGSAVAQGSGHLAVVTGEFGGNTFAVLQLPATAGTATPSLADYAVAVIPGSEACGGTFRAGYDPHTVTAYTSPNDGSSYAVFAGYSGGGPVCLAKVNMTMVINSTLTPRGGIGYDAHDVAPAKLPAGAVQFFTLP